MKRTYNTSSSSYWHENAGQFAEFYHNYTMKFSPEMIINKFLSDRTRILYSLTPITAKTIMLDLGCGSGEQMKEFIPRCHYVYGVDYSRQMIDLAKKELHKFPIKKYSLIRADASHTSLSNKSIDVVVSMGLLDYVVSPDRVVSECRRILRPNGVFVFSLPKSPSIFSFFRIPVGIYVRRKIFHLPPIKNAMNAEEVKRLLARHGFVLQHLTSVWGAMWMIKAILI